MTRGAAKEATREAPLAHLPSVQGADALPARALRSVRAGAIPVAGPDRVKHLCAKIWRVRGTCGHLPGPGPKPLDEARARELRAAGLTFREIAAQLGGVSHQTVKNRLEPDRARLRERWRLQAARKRERKRGERAP